MNDFIFKKKIGTNAISNSAISNFHELILAVLYYLIFR